MHSTFFVCRLPWHNLTVVQLSSTSPIFQVGVAFLSRMISRLTVDTEHLDRVRERVLLLGENKNRSSGKRFVATFV